MASLRKAKKKAKKELLRKTRNTIDEVNSRLYELNRLNYNNTWAVNKLLDRLENRMLSNTIESRNRVKRKVGKKRMITEPKGIKINLKRKLTNTQLVALNKAGEQFLKSETSTVAGVKRAKKMNIKGIQQKLSDDKRGLVSEEDAEFYQNYFEDKDFNELAKQIKYDVLWDLIDEAKQRDVSESDWIKMLGRYINDNDEDVRERAKRLYNKYIE